MTQNIRSRLDEEFTAFLLRVGDGREPTISEDMINLPTSIPLLAYHDNPINNLIDATFSNLSEHGGDATCLVDRAIVTPKTIDKFIGDEKV